MAYLITGGQGCIGAWIVRRLIRSGKQVVLLDREFQSQRLSQILDQDEHEKITNIQGDITDRACLDQVFAAYPIEYVLHLAALQVPACQSDPLQGAKVNVIGTLNVFEAAAAAGARRVVYASSAAVAGRSEDYSGSFTDASMAMPCTHYGVFKQCNEGNARIYYESRGLSSIGLRPWAVYGVGRDYGLTSDPTKAIKAAVVGRPFRIQFGGRLDLQYVDDVAGIFIACAESGISGARVFNLHGSLITVEDFVKTLAKILPSAGALITHQQQQLPIIPEFDDSALAHALRDIPRTSLEQGIAETAVIFQDLLRAGKLPTHEL